MSRIRPHGSARLLLLAALTLAACSSDADGSSAAVEDADTASDPTVDEVVGQVVGESEPAAPAVSADGNCEVPQDERLVVDVINPTGEVSGVWVVVELGKASGNRDEVTVKVSSMAPGERAVVPFKIIGAVPSDCTVLEVDPQHASGFSTTEAADVTACEVVEDNGLAVDSTVTNSGAETADYIMTAGLYDADGVRRYQADVSYTGAPPGEPATSRSYVGFDYVDGLTCIVQEAFRRPER